MKSLTDSEYSVAIYFGISLLLKDLRIGQIKKITNFNSIHYTSSLDLHTCFKCNKYHILLLP